jgi:hypothetical protein
MSSTRNTNHAAGDTTDGRPAFAVALGLLPPYSMEDVKRAYLAKVKEAHPDRGGDRAAFDRIQHAYEQASAYLTFRGDRRQWIAARMEEYVAADGLVRTLRGMGADVETTMHDWVQQSFGDFAALTESILSIRVPASADVAAVLDAMVPERAVLGGLKRLEMAGCAVTDRLALQLRVFSGLTHLDLSHTLISEQALELVNWLRQLEEFPIEGTSIGWWARRKLRWRLARRQLGRPAAVLHPANIR